MKKSSTWRKFKLLMWKGMIIRKRNYICSLIELLSPIAAFLVYALLAKHVDIFPDATIQKALKPPQFNLQELNSNFNLSTKLCYYPTVGFTKGIINKVRSKLKLNANNVLDFKNASKFMEYFAESQGNHSIFAVAFQNLKGSSIPKNFVYSIRPYIENVTWNTATLIGSNLEQGHDPDLGSSIYIKTGFLSLQMALETSFVETVTKKSLPFTLVVQEFPFPQRITDFKQQFFFGTILPQLLVLGAITTVVLSLSKPAIEKSTGIKELMKSAGLSSWLIFLSWYCHFTIVVLIYNLFIVTILTVPIINPDEAMVQYSCFSLLYFILILFSCSVIGYGLFVASRFDNETASVITGTFIWFVLPAIASFNIKSRKLKMVVSIFPPVALTYICKQLDIYEIKGIGAHWSNMYDFARDDSNDLTISDGIHMLCISIVLFTALALYIEQLYPGRYGVPRNYYFIIYHKAFWNKVTQPNKVESGIDLVSDDLLNIEPPARNLRPGIRFKNLCKRYGKVRAVDNLSMDIYEGIITVLLGQNGAGKSTTMSILTGMIAATSGTVLIRGENIQYSMDAVRNYLGYCPQNNINFQELNVMDHFVFFGMLKGHNKSLARAQALVVLTDLNMYDQRKKKAKQLSGGMLRRLSLGIALMGDSKILILDEPTSGLDPETRRELWDILIKLKNSHMVIITTHFMEEADALADRIAIIDHGQLTCYGSPMFLKKLYGSGYRLTITRDKNLFEENNPGENQVDAITQMVRKRLNEAVLVSSNLNCLAYLLPYENKSQYSAVLNEIEQNKKVLCVSHIEMSVITLEEVFLKAGSFAGKDEKDLKFDLQSSAGQPQGFGSLNLQISALLKKRWLVFKRRYLMFLIPMLLGVVICALTFHMTFKTTKKTKENEEEKFDFKLNHYGRTTVYYSTISNKTRYFTKIKKNYNRLVEKQNSDAYDVDDVHKEILNKGEENFELYHNKLIVAAEFIDAKSMKTVNAMFSNPSLHGAIISVNLLCNAILHTVKHEAYSIESSISPLSSNEFNSEEDNIFGNESSIISIILYWVLLFPLGAMCLLLPFMILPQMENASKLKQLQLLCGVNPLIYWGVFYILDLFFYFIWIIPIISIFLIYQNVASVFYFNQTFECYTLILILMIYGLPGIPFVYLYSYSKSIADGLNRYFCNALVCVFYILVEFNILPAKLHYIFALCPQYGLTYLMVEFCKNGIKKYMLTNEPEEIKIQICEHDPNPCCDNDTSTECYNYLVSKYGKTNDYIKYIMIASTLMYFAILYLLENGFLQKLFEIVRLMICREKKTTEEYGAANREDVKLQQERISEILNRELNLRGNVPAENKQDIFLVHELEKSFKRKKVVKNISFSVDEGECFGLLGVNGAGKTTTFRMLTGNLPIIKGECRIVSPSGKRFYLSKTPKKYFRNIGYCPQLDIIEEVLTGREMLVLFGKLRGLSVGLHQEIETLAKCLAFDEILNRACGGYSGGNKRKLSIAMALIGVPTVILLDEPTSGVDPISRRAMWNMIKLIQNQKTKPAIVLTSHSMEECEVLCHKVAIMKEGEFHCYGTIPQLKTKYAEGFYVTLKLSVGENAAQQLQMVDSLKSKFRQEYRDSCHLIDEQATLLQYRISDLTKKWSEIFQDVKQFQRQFSIIEDYTISETTLEQVFLKVARTD